MFLRDLKEFIENYELHKTGYRIRYEHKANDEFYFIVSPDLDEQSLEYGELEIVLSVMDKSLSENEAYIESFIQNRIIKQLKDEEESVENGK